MNLSGIRDVNELKRLLAAGQISQDDLNNTTLSGSFGPSDQLPPPQSAPVNALQGIVNPQDQQAPQDQAPQMPAQTAQQQPPQGSNYVRNEQTGHITYLTPQGLSDTPSMGAVIQAPQGPQAPQSPSMMQVSGYVGQNRVNMGPQQAPGQVNVDYGQPPMELMGGIKAYYSKDEPGVAYVMKDGRPVQKVMLQDQSAQLAYNKEAEAAQLQQAQLAQSQASTAHTLEETRASKIQNPDFSTMGISAGAPMVPQPSQAAAANSALPQAPRNEDFLQSLDPQVASQVKAYADGRLPIPAGFALKSPYFQNMLRLVGQYDPSFDFVNANARNKTYQSFTAGPDAANVTALNTAIYHLSSLKDAYDKLDNGRFPLYNLVANAAGEQLGNTGVQSGVADVNAKAQAVSEELAKVFRSQGMSESEVNAWKSKINTNSSPATSNQTIRSALDLMDGRLQALGDKYNTGMGTNVAGMQLLKPQAAMALQKLQASISGANTSAPQAQPAQAPAARVTSQADYDALPSGATYQDPNGHTRRKR